LLFLDGGWSVIFQTGKIPANTYEHSIHWGHVLKREWLIRCITPGISALLKCVSTGLRCKSLYFNNIGWLARTVLKEG
jgi:hypothetical protein